MSSRKLRKLALPGRSLRPVAVAEKVRCAWATGARAKDVAYHDAEWGVPVRDDRVLFEFLVLEGAQAGLSWSTILDKRDGYRRAFRDFDPARVARMGARDVERLLQDAAIVRHRGKLASAIANARAFRALQREHGSFADWLWGFVEGGRPVQGGRQSATELPARSELSDRISKELKTRSFSFVGSTIVYAYLQAVGVVNDHLVTCFRHAPVARLGRR